MAARPEGPGARAYREGVQSKQPMNDTREAVYRATGGAVFPGMTIIPFHEKVRPIFEQLLAATLVEGAPREAFLANIAARLDYFDQIGALIDGVNWVVDTLKKPYHTVYTLANDDFVFVFTVGVQYHYPHLKDVAVFCPAVGESRGSSKRKCELTAMILGVQVNGFVQRMISDEIAPVAGLSAADAFPNLEPEDEAVPGRDNNLPPLGPEPDVFDPTACKYGRESVLARPPHVLFDMTITEREAFLGMLKWFSVNFRDRFEYDVCALKVATPKGVRICDLLDERNDNEKNGDDKDDDWETMDEDDEEGNEDGNEDENEGKDDNEEDSEKMADDGGDADGRQHAEATASAGVARLNIAK